MFAPRTVAAVTALLLAAAASFPACAPKPEEGGPTPLKIGTLLALTGDLAAYGPPIQNGATLAAQHVNEAGGVLGSPLQIVSRDSRTDPTNAVDAAQKLLSIDKVTAVVGALSSGVTIPVATAVTVPGQVVQISPSSTSPEVTHIDDEGFLFRTVPSDSLQCRVLASLSKERGFEKTAVIYVNNPYGEGLSRAYADAFAELGGEVTAAVPFNKGQASYRSEVQRALAGDAQALVVIAYPENGVKILRQAIEFGLTNNFILSDGMKAPEVIESVGAEQLEGTYGTAPAAARSSLTEAFLEAYESAFGEKPPKPYIDTCFDAVLLVALAAERAGGSAGPAIRDNLAAVAGPPGEKVDFTSLARAFELLRAGEEIDYEGVSGSVDFDAQGDVTGGSYGVWAIEGGQIREVRVEIVK